MKKVIDIHIHGIGGYDTRTSNPARILKIAEIQGRYGISDIIPTIYPAQIEKMRANMEAVKNAMEMQIATHQSRIIGVHLEGPFLNPFYSGALDKRSFLQPSVYSLESLLDGFEDVVRIVTIAPELHGALKLITKIADKGITVSMGHSNATFREAESGFQRGAKGITHIFNAMRGFHHREPGIAGFGILNKDIFIEVITDTLHLSEYTLDLIFKIKRPDRIIMVSDSTKETPEKKYVPSSISKRCTACTQSKLKGGAMTLTQSAQRLIDRGFKDETIMACISSNPLSYIGMHPGRSLSNRVL